jgi:hypothetical protein
VSVGVCLADTLGLIGQSLNQRQRVSLFHELNVFRGVCHQAAVARACDRAIASITAEDLSPCEDPL